MYDKRRARAQIEAWLNEDAGVYDLTTEIMIPAGATGRFLYNAREPLVLAGIEIAAMTHQALDTEVVFEPWFEDGARIEAGAAIAAVEGDARAILTAERVALNLLQRLSGVATLTAAFVAELDGLPTQLVDTRKTTPGLRALEKHAVTCGGGRNHRLGLDSGVMLKDNHIAICGGVAAAVAKARAAAPLLTKIEVECDRLDQVDEALSAGADVIMLDNMSDAEMRAAVALSKGRALLEASGGVRLDTIRAKAETGVDVISVGKITQGAAAVDIGLDAAESA
ncbi:MAG: carboxylating nicotinate-nucleotide diphosphorylase [Pseudomonadota bacterium]